MLGNFSCFYCRLLTFFKIKFLQKNTGATIRVPNSLDPDQDRNSVVFIWVQTVCEILLADDTIPRWHAKSYITGSIYYLIQVGYMYIYINYKYSDALNKCRHAMPFKQSKSNIQVI